MRVWGILRKRQRIALDAVVESDAYTDITLCLNDLCQKLDIPRPMVLHKHENEWEQFGRTYFLPEHFIESVPFDRLEMEIMKERSRSRDPRNDFNV